MGDWLALRLPPLLDGLAGPACGGGVRRHHGLTVFSFLSPRGNSAGREEILRARAERAFRKIPEKARESFRRCRDVPWRNRPRRPAPIASGSGDRKRAGIG